MMIGKDFGTAGVTRTTREFTGKLNLNAKTITVTVTVTPSRTTVTGAVTPGPPCPRARAQASPAGPRGTVIPPLGP